jgi:hypothetical protein
VEAHQNVSLLIGIDRIIALVKVAIAGTHGRTITKRALRARGRGGGALGDGAGIVHVRGAVVATLNGQSPVEALKKQPISLPPKRYQISWGSPLGDMG